MDETKALEIKIEVLYNIFDMWHKHTDGKYYDFFAVGAEEFRNELHEYYLELHNKLTTIKKNKEDALEDKNTYSGHRCDHHI